MTRPITQPYRPCAPTSYEVPRRDAQHKKFREILLEANAGDRLSGWLTEKTGSNFNWFIANDDDLADLENGLDPEGHCTPEEVLVRHKIKCKIPKNRPGRWYLILDIRGLQYDREVEVDLWVEPQ